MHSIYIFIFILVCLAETAITWQQSDSTFHISLEREIDSIRLELELDFSHWYLQYPSLL